MQTNRIKYLKPIVRELDNLEKYTVNTINEAIGTGIFTQATSNNDNEILEIISRHQSDTIRCWSSYTIGENPALNVKQILERIQPFSADKHFGVREISWLAVGETIAKNLGETLKILSSWTFHENENIRRFASEATRPRGVWCAHIDELKQKPELGLAILEPMKSDSSKYVQDSVGNWLNDASKSQPKFVIEICKK